MTTFAPPGDPNSLEYPFQSAGPRRLWEDSHQAAAILQDRMHLPGRIQLIAGGRFDSLHDHNYSALASCSDFTVPGACTPAITNQSIWLPFYAATYTPVSSLTLYGNYSELLSLGPQAAWWVDNANQFLAPYHTRQTEIGAKYEPDQRILLTAALYRMRAPFFYPESDGAGGFNFVSQGRETHDGVELSAQGKAANWLRLTASAAAIDAISNNTGTPAFDNKQVINVPHLHTTVFGDLTVPHIRGLHLMPGWSYSGRKEATRDDTVSVPGVNIFNLGARYTPGGEEGRVTFRIYANNIADKRYWSDTGTNTGDSFLWLGAPTTVRLSAHYTF
jgi:iron complex outermembrane receptor protein